MEQIPESQYVLEKELTEEEIKAQKKAELEEIKEKTRAPKWLQLIYGGVGVCALLFCAFYAYKVYHYRSPEPFQDIINFRLTIAGSELVMDGEYTTVDSRISVTLGEDVSIKANSNLKYVKVCYFINDINNNTLEQNKEITRNAIKRGEVFTFDPYDDLTEDQKFHAGSYSITKIQYKF